MSKNFKINYSGTEMWTKSKGRWPHKELKQMWMFIHNGVLVKNNVSRMSELDRIA